MLCAIQSPSYKFRMQSQKDESNAPLEAYYAAPKHRFDGTSKWNLIDVVCEILWSLLIFSCVSLDLIGIFWIKHSRIVDGVLVVGTWLILVTYIFLHRRKNMWSFLPQTWRPRLHSLFLIGGTLVSILKPIIWMFDHVFSIT